MDYEEKQEYMKYMYEYVFFKYLYDNIGIKMIDDFLSSENIKTVDEENSDKRISKYFSLLNKGDNLYFTEEENDEYSKIFSYDIDELMNSDKYDLAVNFVKRTYEKYFHLIDELRYIYYGPQSFEFMAPSDAIALGLNYKKYDIDASDYDSEVDRQEEIVVNVLNDIQTKLSSEHGLKIAAIAFNEVSLAQPFTRL